MLHHLATPLHRNGRTCITYKVKQPVHDLLEVQMTGMFSGARSFMAVGLCHVLNGNVGLGDFLT